MFAWFAQLLTTIKRRVRYRDKVTPEAIRRLAAELRELAEMAEIYAHEEMTPRDRIKRIQSETGQLIALTERAEFKRLPVDRRIELLESLLASKRHIINSMQATPSPTDIIQ